MTTRNLDKFFNPDSIAVVGATDGEGSIAKILMSNLVKGFEGRTYPINPNKNMVLGIKTLASVEEIPDRVDLATIITPATTVPRIVDECGKAEIPAIIIISAGFGESGGEGRKLEEETKRRREDYGMRILGPNSFGIMRPSKNLNATISDKAPNPGETAFISQSGALGPSILDRLGAAGIGFSAFVSVGNMIDVDFGDLIDYFSRDHQTRTILMHMESIRRPKKFLSAAKSFSRTEPIILEKSGRHVESAEAITSHIGYPPEEDSLYDALFERCGVVRVDKISDLFCCSEALAHKCLPGGPSLAIITNAGGPGIMGVDALLDRGGELAPLSNETIRSLEKDLPPYASKSNPIDISSDADVGDYINCTTACMKDENVDGILIIYTPHGVFSPKNLAKALVDLAGEEWKPILACWMGGETTRKSRDILRRGGIPTVDNPQQSAKMFMYMYEYLRKKKLLYETPEPLSAHDIPLKHHLSQRDFLKSILEGLSDEDRKVLTEEESKNFLRTYGLPAEETHVARTPEKAAHLAEKIGFPIVLKIRTPAVVRKSGIGGVALDLDSKTGVKEAFNKIVGEAETRLPKTKIRGVTVQRMLRDINCELLLGSKKHPRFGSTVLFGRGGIDGRLYQDIAVGFPPLNQVHAQRLMERTKAIDLLEKLNDESSEKIKLLQEYLARLSQLIIDFPEIEEMNITLAGREKGFSAIDAKIILEEGEIPYKDELHDHLIIEPYPLKYMGEEKLKDGSEVTIRPIRPEDETQIFELFDTFSKETWRHRFFGQMKKFNHDDLVRFTSVDYRREIALVGELIEEGKPKIIGMGRLIIDRGEDTGEFAVVVGDPWQGLGLGKRLIKSLIRIGKDKGLDSIWGEMKKNSFQILHLCRKLGFQIEEEYPDTIKMILEFNYQN